MSRTDKDAPNWVTAMHHPARYIDHTYSCEFAPLRYGRDRDNLRPCTLDAPENDHSWKFCRYWVDFRDVFRYSDGPTHAMLRAVYFGPERAAVRVSLRNAVRDFNTNDPDRDSAAHFDADPPIRQARSSAWTGGYCD